MSPFAVYGLWIEFERQDLFDRRMLSGMKERRWPLDNPGSIRAECHLAPPTGQYRIKLG